MPRKRKAKPKKPVPPAPAAPPPENTGKTTLRQQRDSERAARLADTDLRREHYATLPKKLWCQWSGRQHKILDEQAQAYGIPLDGATINLPDVARWIHDLLAAHGRKILAGDAASEIWGDETTSPALERKREVEYQLRLRDLAERDGALVSRESTRQALAQIAGILRHYGDAVQRQFGADALDLFNDSLADCERAIEQFFAGQADSPTSGDEDAGSDD